MNRDSILSVYSDARTEYTKQLCVFLVPAYFQFYVDLLEKSKKTMVQEPKRSLWQFQNYLNEIHDWNMEKVSNEIQLIQTNSGCDYLEDLLTAVFIAHTKVLTAIRLSSNNKKVEITIPKVEHFLFKVLCETAKLLWSSTYLFRDGIPGMEKQQNYRNIENMLHEGILQAVRSLVPVKSILKDFVNNDHATYASQSKDEDSDEEIEPEKKSDDMSISLSASVPVSLAVTESKPDVPLSTIPQLSVDIMQPIQETQGPPTPVIMIDSKPTVRFGQFNAMFDSEHPTDSDMILEPKDGEESNHNPNSENESGPVLQILEEEGTSLENDTDLEILDTDLNAPSESIGLGDYEEL
jgi:Family of unknown function (DUF5764)